MNPGELVKIHLIELKMCILFSVCRKICALGLDCFHQLPNGLIDLV